MHYIYDVYPKKSLLSFYFSFLKYVTHNLFDGPSSFLLNLLLLSQSLVSIQQHIYYPYFITHVFHTFFEGTCLSYLILGTTTTHTFHLYFLSSKERHAYILFAVGNIGDIENTSTNIHKREINM